MASCAFYKRQSSVLAWPQQLPQNVREGTTQVVSKLRVSQRGPETGHHIPREKFGARTHPSLAGRLCEELSWGSGADEGPGSLGAGTQPQGAPSLSYLGTCSLSDPGFLHPLRNICCW